MELRVKVLSSTQNPVETIYYVWEQSKTNKFVPDVWTLARLQTTPVGYVPNFVWKYIHEKVGPNQDREETLRRFSAYVRDVVRKLLVEDVPVIECVSVTLAVEDMPVALREQMVRHRVGIRSGPRISVDVVPELSESSWWMQSHRVLDMSHFYEQGHYYIPQSILGKSCAMPEFGFSRAAEDVYKEAMRLAQTAYQMLVDSGVPPEDARNVLPFGVTHRGTWTLNLRTVKHIVGKRSCWIMQGGLWQDFINQLCAELTDVDELFTGLWAPPCIRGDRYTSCPFAQSNAERIAGMDPNPPCALFLGNEPATAMAAASNFRKDCNGTLPPLWDNIRNRELEPAFIQLEDPEHWGGWRTRCERAMADMARMRQWYEMAWGRDVDTWAERK